MIQPTTRPIWEDGQGTDYPSLDGGAEADVCVIGLGGTGLTAMREAQARGLRVIGIDAGQIAGGAAGRNGGFLLAGLAGFHHDAVRTLGRTRARSLYELTIEQISRLVEETPTAVRRVGSLRLATTPEEVTDCQAHLDALRADGLPAAAYRGPEGAGLLIPSDAAFNPLLRCRHLAADATAAGARLFEHTQAHSIAPGVVDTAGGQILAGLILLATDGQLTRLAPSLASRVKTARLQMLATSPTPEVSIPRPVYARYGMEYWQQLPGGEIALGGFRDLGGEAEWTTSTATSQVIQDALEEFLRRRVGVQAEITHRWAASVSYHDGMLPILAEVEPGVWAMGGYNGTGNLVGALCGRAAVELGVLGQSEIGELLGAVRHGE